MAVLTLQNTTGVKIADIDRAIRDGLPGVEKERIRRAEKALEFYKADFSRYPTRPADASKTDKRYERTAPVMQRVVNTLTGTLYKDGPKRTLMEHEQASEWLGNVYRRNVADALFQQADRLSGVSDVAMFQAIRSADPRNPVKIQLWDASQFSVWLEPDDQSTVAAVAVRDMYDGQRRLTLWTADEKWVYFTAQFDKNVTSGATAYGKPTKLDNPHGFLPFSFVHWDLPVCDFWSGGPGNHLVEVNDCTNYGLTTGFDRVKFNLNPIIKLHNVRTGWKPPAPMQPGQIWDLPANTNSEGQDAAPDATYLEADPSYVVAGWEDLNNYLDTVMAMHGVPPATIRMTQESARSGVSIVAEQIPLILWAKSRQRPFACYEDQLATLVLRVGATHLNSQDVGNPHLDEYKATASQLEEAADNLSLALRWPKMFPDMPGIEQDQADQWLLDNHLTSRTQVLMRRESMTREEAEDALEEIAEDLVKEQEMFAALAPEVAEPPNADPAKTDDMKVAKEAARMDGNEEPLNKKEQIDEQD